MIKVITPGTRRRVECPECGAVLTYEQSDVVQSGGMLPGSKHSTINCPSPRPDNPHLTCGYAIPVGPQPR